MVRGEILYKNGDQYNGELQNGKMGGQGLYRFKNGDNQFEGRGKLVDKFNDITIVGQFKNGQPNGYSRVVYGDGSEYEGPLKNGLRHGKGMYKYAKNQPLDQYEGTFEEDEFQGFGELVFKDRSRYKGDFKNNVFHGQGEYSTSQFLYIGSFHKGVIQGKGIMKFPNNEYYDGQFQMNKRNGYGKFQYADGSEYVGSWKENLRHGKGKIRKTNQDYMECQFQNDKRNGQIVGSIGNFEIIARMSNQKLNGPIKITSPSIRIEGSYKDGCKDGRITVQKQNKRGQKVTYQGEFKLGKENPYVCSFSHRF